MTDIIKSTFLSCLCGCPRNVYAFTVEPSFLSCLCGCSLVMGALTKYDNFLSCLCGCSPSDIQALGVKLFLSCLCGCSLLKIVDISKIIKGLYQITQKYHLKTISRNQLINNRFIISQNKMVSRKSGTEPSHLSLVANP